MRSLFLAAALAAALCTPAIAQDDAAAPTIARAGQTLRDAKMARIGAIDRVYPDGSVRLIVDGHFATVPAASISITDGVVKTSLTRKDVARLR